MRSVVENSSVVLTSVVNNAIDRVNVRMLERHVNKSAVNLRRRVVTPVTSNATHRLLVVRTHLVRISC